MLVMNPEHKTTENCGNVLSSFIVKGEFIGPYTILAKYNAISHKHASSPFNIKETSQKMDG